MDTKKDILLCITGLTPQVVTETLYALHHNQEPLPAEIHILSTAEGAERARLTLLNDRWLSRFYQDYGLPPAQFEVNHIHVVQHADGQPLQDIRNQLDNQATADCITEWIRRLTEQAGSRLHVSIAGGRKTMGFYAGYALSLYGRDHDRLSHVLVSAPFESHPQFYYPTPYPQTIYANDRTSTPLDTQQAEVMLADIAFVRLRHGLDESLLHGRSSFTESVKRAQQTLGPASLQIDLAQRRLIAQTVEIAMKPAELAFYLWLLENQFQASALPITCPCEGAPDKEYAQAYLNCYHRVIGELGQSERTEQALADGMTKSFFEQRKSRVNQTLKHALTNRAEPYLIHAVGKRPRTYYRIALQQEQVSSFQRSALECIPGRSASKIKS